MLCWFSLYNNANQSSLYKYKTVLSRFSHVCLFVTPWTVARQAPLSMGFSRQEYWSGFLCPPPGDLPNPGTEPASLTSPALAGRFFTTSATWEVLYIPSLLSLLLIPTPLGHYREPGWAYKWSFSKLYPWLPWTLTPSLWLFSTKQLFFL